MEKIILVTNESTSISFIVRIVEKGDTYGRNHCLTHDKDEKLVEFYDNRYPHFDEVLGYGQFVSRYYAETLLKSEGGLCLDGGVPDWWMTDDNMSYVRIFINNV